MEFLTIMEHLHFVLKGQTEEQFSQFLNSLVSESIGLEPCFYCTAGRSFVFKLTP